MVIKYSTSKTHENKSVFENQVDSMTQRNAKFRRHLLSFAYHALWRCKRGKTGLSVNLMKNNIPLSNFIDVLYLRE
jgi:hypothetical protein